MVRTACLLLIASVLIMAQEPPAKDPSAKDPNAPWAELVIPRHLIPDVGMACELVLHNCGEGLRSYSDLKVDGLETQLLTNVTSMKNINGVTSVSYRLQIKATRTGAFRIPTIELELRNGTRLKTDPLDVTVAGPQAFLTGDPYAEAVFLPNTVVPGEESLCRWLVYVPYQDESQPQTPERLIANGEDLSAVDVPSIAVSGWALGKNGDTRRDIYRIFSIEQKISATRPGTYKSEGQVTLGTLVGFTRRFRATATVPIAKPAELKVIALPVDGRPANFTGIVGAISLSAVVDRTEFRAGEGSRLTVTVTGQRAGLITSLPLPSIKGIAIYPQKGEETPEGRVFRYDLVPERAGEYTVPALQVAWFDPSSRSYRQAASQPMRLTVYAGREIHADATGAIETVRRASPTLTPQLPALLVGQAGLPRSVAAGWWILGLGLVAGALLSLGVRILPLLAKGPDPLRLARSALCSSDLATIDAALHRILATCRDPQVLDRGRQALKDVENARFGGGRLDDTVRARLTALAKDLS